MYFLFPVRLSGWWIFRFLWIIFFSFFMGYRRLIVQNLTDAKGSGWIDFSLTFPCSLRCRWVFCFWEMEIRFFFFRTWIWEVFSSTILNLKAILSFSKELDLFSFLPCLFHTIGIFLPRFHLKSTAIQLKIVIWHFFSSKNQSNLIATLNTLVRLVHMLPSAHFCIGNLNLFL